MVRWRGARPFQPPGVGPARTLRPPEATAEPVAAPQLDSEDEQPKREEQEDGVAATNSETVDITPSVNVLLQAGDGYDFRTALAEMIDNCIQNTFAQRRRVVHVSLENRDRGDAAVLHIRDNGCGMTAQGVHDWARLGQEGRGMPQWEEAELLEAIGEVARSPQDTKSGYGRCTFESEVSVADHLSSDFSRYGVGSKKAVFNLGRQVTVTTRARGTNQVTECTLSEAGVREQGWKATVATRAPRPDEGDESFTDFAVSQLSPVYLRGYDAQRLRGHLGHIYHYYVWGPGGNSSKPGEEAAEPEPAARRVGPPFYPVRLVVDGVDVREAGRGDAETLLLQNGVERVSFDVVVGDDLARRGERDALPPVPMLTQVKEEVGEEAEDDPQPTADAIPPATEPRRAKVVLLYFPFRDGRETLPVPGCFGHMSEDAVPLVDRQPGLEVFWNGRLLPKEHIQHHALLRAGVDSGIPAACWRRVKGMVFVDSRFAVSTTKLNLCSQSAPVRALLDFESEPLAAAIRRWVKGCHESHDQKFDFGPQDDTKERVRGVIHYQWVKFAHKSATLTVKLGCNVTARRHRGSGRAGGGTRFVGKVVGVCQDFKAADSAECCFVDVHERGYDDGDDDEAPQQEEGSVVRIPAGCVERVVKEKEAKEMLRRMQNSAPAFVEAVNVDGKRSSVLQGRLICGEGLRARLADALRFALMNRSYSRCIAKAVRLEVTIVAKPAPGASVTEAVTATYSCDPPARRQAPYYTVPVSALTAQDGAAELFNFAGTYDLQLRAPLQQNGLSRTIRMHVLPDVRGALTAEAASEEALPVRLGDGVAVPVRVRDVCGNSLAWADVEGLKLSATADLADAQGIELAEQQLEVTAPPSAASTVAVAGVKLRGQVPDGPCEVRLAVALTVGGRQADCDVLLAPSAGVLCRLALVEPPAEVSWDRPFAVVLRGADAGGNTIPPAGLTCVAEVSGGDARLAGKSKPSVPGDDFGFTFPDMRLLCPRGADIPEEDVKVTIDFYLKGKKGANVSPAQAEFTVVAGAKAPRLVLEGPGVRADGRLNFLVSAAAGARVEGLCAVVQNAPTEGLPSSARVLCQWADGDERAVDADMKAELPALAVAAQLTRQQYIMTLRMDDVEQQHVVTVSTHAGPPAAVAVTSVPGRLTPGEPFAVGFAVTDRLGNAVDRRALADVEVSVAAAPHRVIGDQKVRCGSGGWEVTGVRVTGRAGQASLKLLVRAGGVDIESDARRVELAPAPPALVTIAGQPRPADSPLCATVRNWGVVDRYTVAVADEFGTTLPLDDSWKLTVEQQVQHPAVALLPADEGADPPMSQQGGRWTPLFRVLTAPGAGPETLDMMLTLWRDGCPALRPGHLRLSLVAGAVPWNVAAEHCGDQKVLALGDAVGEAAVAGDRLGEWLRVKVFSEDGTPATKVPLRCVTLRVVSAVLPEPKEVRPSSRQRRRSVEPTPPGRSQVAGEDGVGFPNLADVTCTAAGQYTVQARLDLTFMHPTQPHVKVLRKIGCAVRELPIARFRVRHADPAALTVCVREGAKRGVPQHEQSAHLGAFVASSPERQLLRSAHLRLEDQFGNACTSVDGGHVRVEVVAPDCSAAAAAGALPVLADSTLTAAAVVEGGAEIGPVLLAESQRCSEGPYALRCSYHPSEGAGPAATCDLHFQWTDDTERQQLLQRLLHRAAELDEKSSLLERQVAKLRMRADRLSGVEKDSAERLADSRELVCSVLGDNGQPIIRASQDFDPAAAMEEVSGRMRQLEQGYQREVRQKDFGQKRCPWLRKVASVPGFCGVVGDVGYVRREDVDRCVAAAFGAKMRCVVLSDDAAVRKVRSVMSGTQDRAPMLAMDNIRDVALNRDGYVEQLRDPTPPPRGWVGWAVNLIEMEQDKRHLRRALYALVGGRAVFETIADAKAWRRSRLSAGASCPAVSCLDGETMEPSGVEYFGRPTDNGLRFGSPGVRVDPMWQRLQLVEQRLRTYSELLQSSEAELRKARSREAAPRAKMEDLAASADELKRRSAEIRRLAAAKGAIAAEAEALLQPLPAEAAAAEDGEATTSPRPKRQRTRH
eukprot:TRINITY_DN2085_c0_g1_i1.p1 TRINITY_DN2085_c0_g1~~TRINITY_DN2085_c0_g1_i1.p1  ORF type:complete len:2077 (+),score=805.52 TRINITY_DN2085_c0_g1_i1:42-6233(+)